MEGILSLTENSVVKEKLGVTEEDASFLMKEEQDVEGERHAVDLSLLKKERVQDDAEASEQWNELQVKGEQEEEEVPLPASVTLPHVKEEENDPSLTEDPLRMVMVVASDGEDANDTADLPQPLEEVRTTQSASGSRRRAKKSDEPVGRRLQCNLCASSFSRTSSLTTHMRIHTGERPYKCDVCGRSFSQRSNLVSHMRSHTGDRPYECDVCGKSCSDRSSLVRHMRTHTGERPYACQECGSSFAQSGQLVAHMRTHTGERPFKCDVCETSFSDPKTLVCHKRMHTGERPYKCNVCGKSCSQKPNLVSHMRVHKGARPSK